MALAWNAGWVNALAGSNPASSALSPGRDQAQLIGSGRFRTKGSRRSMRRRAAIFWPATRSVAAGVLYFFFVLPRWPELVGDTSHALGTAARIIAGVVIALAALPVVFTLLESRKPEF